MSNKRYMLTPKEEEALKKDIKEANKVFKQYFPNAKSRDEKQKIRKQR